MHVSIGDCIVHPYNHCIQPSYVGRAESCKELQLGLDFAAIVYLVVVITVIGWGSSQHTDLYSYLNILSSHKCASQMYVKTQNNAKYCA